MTHLAKATILGLGLTLAGACSCTPKEAEPLVCSTVTEGCACATLGCACSTEGTCNEGTCNEFSNTCVLVEEGMVFVPAGPFWMGCRDGHDTDEITGPCPVEELPYRQVTLDAYWIDQLEVTKAEYRACMEAGVCTTPYLWDEEFFEGEFGDVTVVPGPDDFPAASISWTQARDYCEWAGKRLPTEAEWEKAARGIDGRRYAWGNEAPTCELANFAGVCDEHEEYKTLTPVGFFPAGASPYGALDMTGNAEEWTNDGIEADVGYGDLPSENPTGIESENGRVFRGGGYMSAELAYGGYILRTSRRGHGRLSWTALTLDFGFRCAKDAEPEG